VSTDTPPPVLPPGCSLRGRTLHLDLDLDLAWRGAEERPDSRVGDVIHALDAARYYGLSVTLGGDPQTSPARRIEQAALDSASGALLELAGVPGLPDEAWRLAALASLWIAAARSLIPGQAVLDAMRRLTATASLSSSGADRDEPQPPADPTEASNL
jgi:hypothetical protein